MIDETQLLAIWLIVETTVNIVWLSVDIYLRVRKNK
jgi:hypothetical protein